MGQIITWSTPAYTTDTEHTGFTLGLDVQRYKKFRSAYSIKLPLKGKLLYRIGEENIDVSPGQYLLINQGTEMECLPCRPGIEALFVNFSRALLCDVLQAHTVPAGQLLEYPFEAHADVCFFEYVYSQSPALDQKLNDIAACMKSTAEPLRSLSPDIFFSLAGRLLADQNLIRSQILAIRATSLATRQELYRRVLRAREFMQENWQLDLTLTDIAREACLSPYHFHRTFREAFGESPVRWLRTQRLTLARNMLRSGGRTVTEVAWQCGYADVFAFSKAYKRKWGYSPSSETSPV